MKCEQTSKHAYTHTRTHAKSKQSLIHKAKDFAITPTDVLQKFPRARKHSFGVSGAAPENPTHFLSKHICGGSCKKCPPTAKEQSRKPNTHAKSKETYTRQRVLQSFRQMCCKTALCWTPAHAHTTQNPGHPGQREPKNASCLSTSAEVTAKRCPRTAKVQTRKPTHTQKANKHKANDFCSHPDRCAAK